MLLAQQSHLTTGQVARLCNVAPRTVGKWFDAGTLPGLRSTDGRERHYQLTDVMDFMSRHAIPMGELRQGSRRIGLVEVDAVSCAALRRAALQTGYELDDIPHNLSGGFALARSSPGLLILNADRIGADALTALRDHPRLQLAGRVALTASTSDLGHRKLRAQGFHHVLIRPMLEHTALNLLHDSANVKCAVLAHHASL